MDRQLGGISTSPAGGPSGAGRGFEDLYAAHLARLVTQVYFVTGDVEEARDCVQEAFARAWLRWDRLSREVSDPIAWVSTVAYRIAVSGWRRRQVSGRAVRRLGPPPPMPGPSADAVAVTRALAGLPHGQRAAIVLHYFVGLRVEEIAGVLGLTASGVKSRLARARAALGPLLEDEESDRA
jgi:RNA polymerase sigma-70 factor (ECF subfamily)